MNENKNKNCDSKHILIDMVLEIIILGISQFVSVFFVIMTSNMKMKQIYLHKCFAVLFETWCVIIKTTITQLLCMIMKRSKKLIIIGNYMARKMSPDALNSKKKNIKTSVIRNLYS